MAGLVQLILDRRQRTQDAADQAARQQGLQELTGRAPIDLAGIPGAFEPERVSQGTGLLADPSDLGRQAKFAAGAAALPGGDTGLLGQVLTQGAATGRQETSLAQQESQFGRSLLQRISEFQQTDAAGGADDALDREKKRLEIERLNRETSQAAVNDPFNVFNPLTMGQPGGGTTRVDPKQFATQQREHDSMGNLLRSANRAQELLDEFGSEIWNAEAVGEFQNLRADMLLRSSNLRDAGAPQAAELELAAAGLPDPQSLFNNLTAPLRIGERDKWIAGYKTFGEQISSSFISQLGVNPVLASELDLISPEFLEKRGIDPDLWDFFRETRGQRIE